MRAAHPPALRPGARVAVTCPASPVSEDRLSRGIDRLREMGFEVVIGDTCKLSTGLWAGDDLMRANELMAFLQDGTIDAIFAGRGGVGCLRLLPHIESLPGDLRPKWIVGRSDLTALQLGLWGRLGWISLSGPMVASDLGMDPPASMIAATRRLLSDPRPLGRIDLPPMTVWRSGQAEGPLIPANLSLLASMVGTRYLPSLHGAILVLEEIDEPTHRCDRMLTQLRLSGALDGLAGLVLGQFTTSTPHDRSSPPDLLPEVLRRHAEEMNIPTLAGFPYGHEAVFQPLPVGVRARIETDPPGLALLEGAAARVDGDRT